MIKKIFKYFIISVLTLVMGIIGLSFLPGFRYLQTIAYAGFDSDIEDYKIFVNSKVKAAESAQAWPLAHDYNKKSLTKTENEFCEKYGTIALLVIQNGEIKLEKYWDGFNESSLSGSFSMAKTVTALLIGAAIAEGKIKSIDQKVADFIPSFQEGDKAKISIREVLNMSSGLAWDESYGNPFAAVAKAYFDTKINDLINNLGVREPAGKIWRYQSGDTQVLGMILQKATGKSIAEYASEKLWQPLGNQYDALWSIAPDDKMEKVFCCLNSNARDFARLGQLVLNQGKWQNKQLISADFVKFLTSPASHLQDTKGDAVKHYGGQMWIAYHQNLTVPCFRGVLGQYIMIIPEKNALVVRLGRQRSNEMIRYCPQDLYTYLDMGLARLD
jgi:CubicO group peptidase (beta-lactamase class C family)